MDELLDSRASAGFSRSRAQPAKASSPDREPKFPSDLLQQAQLAGASDGFGAALHLEFVEDPAVVPFDSVQGQEKALTNLAIRESQGEQLQDFQLAL